MAPLVGRAAGRSGHRWHSGRGGTAPAPRCQAGGERCPTNAGTARSRPTRHGEWSPGPPVAARTRPPDTRAHPRSPDRPTARRRPRPPSAPARPPGPAARRPPSSAPTRRPRALRPATAGSSRRRAPPRAPRLRPSSSASASQLSRASTSGWYIASTAPKRRLWPHSTWAPSPAACSHTLRTKTVLPMPASPWTSTARGEPSRPARTTSSNLARSSARPDSVGAIAAGLMTSSVTPRGPTVSPHRL